ncbi:hypothetical protein [Paraflavitalea sp. CAU 1676]|uniref:hypothetical protein n=1 Tax=Paraflavitalea sp. CAU 1676 TaxID=3032598 RepID=UPI0023DCE4BB|nr:hypothetical protein [Paraflavitalea sp. CAU 1676]MDF2192632.1 hypothetical protein [Paraflavitalea sp. CAU 1676]
MREFHRSGKLTQQSHTASQRQVPTRHSTVQATFTESRRATRRHEGGSDPIAWTVSPRMIPTAPLTIPIARVRFSA